MMRLRALSPHHAGQEVSAVLLPGWKGTPGFPMLLVEGDLTLSLEEALTSHEAIEATADERCVLQQRGHRFGGAQ
ncbi:MAG: hypothetical protein IMZ69_11855 [Spirochaetes bacterium]|nr:hypothetical protein [Spirochaetota bacterium]